MNKSILIISVFFALLISCNSEKKIKTSKVVYQSEHTFHSLKYSDPDVIVDHFDEYGKIIRIDDLNDNQIENSYFIEYDSLNRILSFQTISYEFYRDENRKIVFTSNVDDKFSKKYSFVSLKDSNASKGKNNYNDEYISTDQFGNLIDYKIVDEANNGNILYYQKNEFSDKNEILELEYGMSDDGDSHFRGKYKYNYIDFDEYSNWIKRNVSAYYLSVTTSEEDSKNGMEFKDFMNLEFPNNSDEEFTETRTIEYYD